MVSSPNWLIKLQRKHKWKTVPVTFSACRKNDFWLDPMRQCPCYVCRCVNDYFDPKKLFYFSLLDTKGNLMGRLSTTEANLLCDVNKVSEVIAKRENKQLLNNDPTRLCPHCKEGPCIMLTNREKYLTIGDELRKDPLINNRDLRYILYRVVFEDWFDFLPPKKRRRVSCHRGGMAKIQQQDIPLCVVLELQANYPEVPPADPYAYSAEYRKREECRLESLIGNHNVVL